MYYLQRGSQVAYKKGPRALYQHQSILISNIVLVIKVHVVSLILFCIALIICLSLLADQVHITVIKSE